MDRAGWTERVAPWMENAAQGLPCRSLPRTPESGVGQDESLTRGKDLEPRGGGRTRALQGQVGMGLWVQTG